MKNCTVYHTGVYESVKGIIKDNKVYIYDENNKLVFPEEMFLAKEECEENLIQLQVDSKWGYADIYSGEIIINTIWDYVDPFYHGYAHVVEDAEIEDCGRACFNINGGKHGYINNKGEVVIPLEYDDAQTIPYKGNFIVSKNNKWGIIDSKNKILIHIIYDYLSTSYMNKFVICGKAELSEGSVESIKWGVYNEDYDLIVEPELIKKPYELKIKKNETKVAWPKPKKYYILENKDMFGVLCEDGRLITNITLTKNEAENIIKALS